jgi:hypothetical protein
MCFYFLGGTSAHGLYTAPVAKSTITAGKNSRKSAINAPARTLLAGCPAAGFVLWHSDTCPPNTVAQEVSKSITAASNTMPALLVIVFIIIIGFG